MKIFFELLISIGALFIKEIYSLYYRMFPTPLSDAEKLFIKQNGTFWGKYANECPKDRYVLIEPSAHPVPLLSNASFGLIVANSKKLKPLFLIKRYRKPFQFKRILESYPNANFAYVDGLRNLVPIIRAWFQAIKDFRSLQSPEDLLRLEVDGMIVGDIIYDRVLSYGYGTVHAIDEKVFRALFEFCQERYSIKAIISKYEIETAILGQLMGLNGGTYAKYLLQGGIEILNRVGSYQISLKKYHSLNDMGTHPCTPIPDYFNAMIENKDRTVQRLAREYLEKRIGGGVVRVDAALAFDKMKKTFTDKKSFCAEYDLDSTLPIVFVMLHAFNDCPHWNFPKKMLFLDYYQWFMRTLEIAKKVLPVNWIFKEHPTQRFYPLKDLDIKTTMDQVNSSHIRFIDGQANFNTGSLRHLAHAIVTGMGSAGLEFSAYGIPCVLAGEGGYSGFGFTIEPQDIKEYEKCLRHIDQLQRLRNKQIEAANVLTYYWQCMQQDHRYFFCPAFSDDAVSLWRPKDTQILLEKAAADFQDAECVKKMRKQVEDLARFIGDDSWIQYFDKEKYPFLQEAIK